MATQVAAAEVFSTWCSFLEKVQPGPLCCDPEEERWVNEACQGVSQDQ